jgi:hypothetical protein
MRHVDATTDPTLEAKAPAPLYVIQLHALGLLHSCNAMLLV